ncbi:hypothetical protein ACFQ0R_07640 [Psychroflexus salinarum]|uniref:LPXTG-motif cell wall anchor domain-containing protein n=1 Tax=Psychroflexus salinarum TaxID=546024 RepID=A0ABW3GR05_9FLAO
MQTTVTKPESSNSESYSPFELTEFLQENWLYIALFIIAIILVVKFSKRSKKSKKEE